MPAYCYRFNAIPAGISYYVGVTHFQEVAFIFLDLEGYGYTIASGGNPFAVKSQNYTELSYLIASSWASFVHDQDPNSFGAENPDVAKTTKMWPVYSIKGAVDYVFDANVSSYAEPDMFREAGLSLINSAAGAFG